MLVNASLNRGAHKMFHDSFIGVIHFLGGLAYRTLSILESGIGFAETHLIELDSDRRSNIPT